MSAHDRKSSEESGDLDLQWVETALRRAAARVRGDAAAVGGTVVVYRDGKIVWEKPGPEWLPHGSRRGSCLAIPAKETSE